MRTKTLSTLGLLALVGSAGAVTFNVQSNGTATVAGSHVTILSPNATQYLTGTSAGYAFADLTYGFDAAFVGASRAGTVSNGLGFLTLKDPANSMGVFHFTFAGGAKRLFTTSLDGLSLSNVSFGLVGVSGFAKGLSGTGSFSANKSFGSSGTTFTSSFRPVPEPTSLAALAIVSLASRKKRRR